MERNVPLHLVCLKEYKYQFNVHFTLVWQHLINGFPIPFSASVWWEYWYDSKNDTSKKSCIIKSYFS